LKQIHLKHQQQVAEQQRLEALAAAAQAQGEPTSMQQEELFKIDPSVESVIAGSENNPIHIG
jgi:hypothetical protein